MSIFNSLKQFLDVSRRYYKNDRTDIAYENLGTLRIVGALGSIVSFIFFALAPKIIPSWTITTEYICIVPILALTFVFATLYPKLKPKCNPTVVEVACALFYISILVVFIALSVFPYPNTPQIFISLGFMFLPALLIMHPLVLTLIIICSETVFIILVLNFKTTFAIENDIFNTVASIFFALIMLVITNRLRSKNYYIRMELQKLGQTDALTTLLNKKAFDEACAFYLGRQNIKSEYTFIIIDLDNFKQVNDEYGHLFGDMLLTCFGDIISRSFRQSDIKGRIGGDEFAVLLCGVNNRELLNRKFADLHEKCSSAVIDGKQFPIQFSIGASVSLNDAPVKSYAALFHEADSALYEIKRRKKLSGYNPGECNWLITESYVTTDSSELIK